MSLAAGTRVGPYAIAGRIGAGAMGEVYEARDTRLARTVAIKILPGHVSGDPDRRARFEREARAVAALSHAHICTLYDVGVHDGSLYLVMEHLTGETLAERLRKGPLPLDLALEVATEIAEALAAAHGQGVVHRDVKPGNIMLAKSGAKLLDFGLAKLVPSGIDASAATVSTPIADEPVTRVGIVLGTVPYMAPEQLEGKEADARSDIFSFGAVVYEMLTGRPAYGGTSLASVASAILGRERPSARDALPGIPAALEHLVITCLARDPADRWQSARDIVLYLSAYRESALAPSTRRRSRTASTMAAISVIALVVAMAGLGWWSNSRRPPAPVVTRLSLPLQPDWQLAPNDGPGSGSSVAISPDGRAVALVVTRDGAQAIDVRFLESGVTRRLPGTEGAMSPFFSPDGRWVGFFARGGGLKKVSLDDGTPITICETPPVPRGAAWAGNGTIYFTPDFSRGLQRVPDGGGIPQDLTQVNFEAGESNHLLPDVLPGDEGLLFTVWKSGSFKDASVWFLSLRTGERKHLVDSATAPRYVPPGYLAFARDGVLFAAPFDPVRGVLTGEAFSVVDGVWTDPTSGPAHYAVAGDGTLVFAAGRNTVEQRRLVWVDRQGHATPLQAEANPYGNLRLSPDAQRVAVELLNDIWVYDLRTGAMNRVTYRSVNAMPVWTPDGQHIAISSSQGERFPTLFWIAADGGRPAERLARGGGIDFPGSWDPDGRRLAYAELHEGSSSGWDIRMLDLQTGPVPDPLVATPFTDYTPMISPDGRALAYVSDETGRPQVYLRPLPNQGTRIQVSTDGGTEPVWSRRGDELFFRSGRRMLAVRVKTEGPLVAGAPIVLFEGAFLVTSSVPALPSYDVAPDGRFLMVTRASEQPLPRQLEVILNWSANVSRRASQTKAHVK